MTAAYADTPTVGTRIAPHLELRAVLGEGGSATVFEAYHERLCASVAVKVAMRRDSYAQAVANRLVREARICARLDDPHFPRVYDIAELPDGRPYYVMERVYGRTLDQFMGGDPLELGAAVHIANELLVALVKAHGQGVVHRDVKPANVILQESHGEVVSVRLMDFGIAHLHAQALDAETQSGPRTIQGEVLGTPGYMPPEQIRGEKVDVRADLYAVGATVYEMLLGRSPLEGEDPLRATLMLGMPDPDELLPAVPEELRGWIRRMTAAEADDRFSRADEALEALTSLDLPVADPTPSGAWESEPLRTHPPPRLDEDDDDEGYSFIRKSPSFAFGSALLVSALAAATSFGVWVGSQAVGVVEPGSEDAAAQVSLREIELAQERAAHLRAAMAARELERQRQVDASEASARAPAPTGDLDEGDVDEAADADATPAEVEVERASDRRRSTPSRASERRRRASDEGQSRAVDAAPRSGVDLSDYMQRLESVLKEPTRTAPKQGPKDIPDNPYGDD